MPHHGAYTTPRPGGRSIAGEPLAAFQSPVPDAYRVLGLDPRASREEIVAAYHRLAKLYHPDGASPDMDRMAAVNAAYSLIKTPEQRDAYDQRLRAMARQQGTPGSQPPGTTSTGSMRIDFGRYQGRTIEEVGRADPFYLRWLRRHSAGLRYRAEIDRVLSRQDLGRRAALFHTAAKPRS